MSKLVVLVLFACSMQAGTIGLVTPGDHPNYAAQLPSDLTNNTGISLNNLLVQNPQNSFAFISQTDSGPRNLIGIFSPILPALQVVLTTPYVAWVRLDEPNFERFIPPPPTGCEVTGTCPPPPPPPGCEVTHSCPPPPPVCLHDCHPLPPNCEVTGTCPPPVCVHDCDPPPPPPPTEVPEPKGAVLVLAGIAGIAALRRRAH